MSCELPALVTLESCLCDNAGELTPGDSAQIEVRLKVDGVETAASSISIVVTDPAGTPTTYVYGVDSELTEVENEVGKYQLAFTITDAPASVGVWEYVWSTSGGYAGELFGQLNVVADRSQLIVEVQDGSAGLVAGARVSLLVNGLTSAGKATNALGQATFPRLLDGSYTVEVLKPGWRFATTAYAKSGAATLVVTGTDLSISTAPTVALCRLYGYLIDSSGRPLREKILISTIGKGVRAWVGTGAVGVDPESAAVGMQQVSVRSSRSSGFWEIELVQGARVRVWVPSLGKATEFLVPAQDTLNYADVRPPPAPHSGGEPQRP